MAQGVLVHALLNLVLSQNYTEETTFAPSGEGDCYGLLGCFPSDVPPWTGPERPVSVPPQSPDRIPPTFCLHTPERPQCYVLNADDFAEIYSSGLDSSAPLYFVTHGYLESANLPWMQKMVSSLLNTAPKVGVLAVDWSKAAPPPYAQAVANIRLIGAATGYLIHVLAEYYDVNLKSVHLVGHSLGSHLMGYAGEYVYTIRGEKVGRITGLDPAGPYFTNTPPEVRLDPSDADFVDAIHTDIPTEGWQLNKLGHPDPLGHVDFYPNGGSEQVGCQGSAHSLTEGDQSVADRVLAYIGCNHQRSHEFFTESVHSRCRFVGVPCYSWEKYMNGECWDCNPDEVKGHGKKCPTMGFHATFAGSNEDTSQPSGSANSSDSSSLVGGKVPDLGRTLVNVSDTQSSEVPKAEEGHSVKVFLGTGGRRPFCAEQYRITVVTSSFGGEVTSEGDLARFTVGLHGQEGIHTIPAPERPTFVEAGTSLSWVGFGPPVGRITGLRVFYEEDHGVLHSLIFRFSAPHLYVEEFRLQELSTGVVTRFPFCGRKMEAGESHTLYPDQQCREPIPTERIPGT